MQALISGAVFLFLLAAIAGWDARRHESAHMAAAGVTAPAQGRPVEGDAQLVPVTHLVP